MYMNRHLFILAAVIVFLGVAAINGDAEMQDKRLIAYAKQINASDLDSSLPKTAFAQWLEEITGPNAKIIWETNDCGEQTGSPKDSGRDIPTCVEAKADLKDSRKLVIRIAVGTIKKGILKQPSFSYGSIEKGNQDYAINFNIKRLSDLSEMLKLTSIK